MAGPLGPADREAYLGRAGYRRCRVSAADGTVDYRRVRDHDEPDRQFGDLKLGRKLPIHFYRPRIDNSRKFVGLQMSNDRNEYPLRTSNHVTEARSRRRFEQELPSYWETRESTGVDYGVDLRVEIFDKDDHPEGSEDWLATGDTFAVQLKGTAVAKNADGSISVQMRTATLQHLANLFEPVLLVVVHFTSDDSKGEVRAKWLHSFDFPAPSDLQATFTVNWAPQDALRSNDFQRVRQEVERFRRVSIRHRLDSLGIHCETDASPKHRMVVSFLKSAIHSAGAPLYWCDDHESAIMHVKLTDVEVSVDLSISTARSRLAHLSEADSRTVADFVLTLVSRTLARCGIDAPAITLARTTSYNWNETDYELIQPLIRAAARLGDCGFFPEIVRDLDPGKSLHEFFYISLMISSEGSVHRPLDDRSLLALSDAVDRQSKVDSVGAATMAYTLGNFLLNVRSDYPGALEAYEKAKLLRAAYETESYFQAELAGAQFEAKLYSRSAASYRRAADLMKQDSIPADLQRVNARRADALAFGGNCSESITLLRGAVSELEPLERAPWALKLWSLELLEAEGVELIQAEQVGEFLEEIDGGRFDARHFSTLVALVAFHTEHANPIWILVALTLVREHMEAELISLIISVLNFHRSDTQAAMEDFRVLFTEGEYEYLFSVFEDCFSRVLQREEVLTLRGVDAHNVLHSETIDRNWPPRES